MEYKFVNIQTCYWYKDNVPSEGGHRFVSSVECMVLAWKKSNTPQYWNFGAKVKQRHNLLQFGIDKPYKIEGAIVNPCQKPLELMKFLLTCFCHPGGLVLDICGGSGSMALACYDFGADCIYVDKLESMVLAAIQRLKEHIALDESKKETEEATTIVVDQIESIEGHCLACGEKTMAKCASCHLPCCSKCSKFIDGRNVCGEKCEGPPPKCGRCKEWLGLEECVQCSKCTSQIHRKCVPRNKDAVCSPKCEGKSRAYPTGDFEKSIE